MNQFINYFDKQMNNQMNNFYQNIINIIFNNIIKKGFYIPIISIFLYFMYSDIYISSLFFLKGYIVNYYYFYAQYYPNPSMHKIIHFFRLTDSGHIASLLFILNKKYVSLAHNIHFVIDVGYYIAYLLFNMKPSISYNNNILEKIHDSSVHSLFYIFIVHYIFNHKNEEICNFNNESLFYTYAWINGWFIFIFIPWVYCTNIYFYSVLEPSKPLYLRLGMIMFMNSLVYIGNETGKFLCNL